MCIIHPGGFFFYALSFLLTLYVVIRISLAIVPYYVLCCLIEGMETGSFSLFYICDSLHVCRLRFYICYKGSILGSYINE